MNKASIKARRKRLVVLADFLEGTVLPMLDGAKFDMGTWGRWQRGRPAPENIEHTSECGFSGCAIGWGYFAQPLRRAGIRKHFRPGCDCQWCRADGVNTRNVDDDGLQAFFGLADEEFEDAFLAHKDQGRRGIRRVAARLRKIAAAEPPAEVAP